LTFTHEGTTANPVDGLTGFFTDEVRLSLFVCRNVMKAAHVALQFLRAGQAGLVCPQAKAGVTRFAEHNVPRNAGLFTPIASLIYFNVRLYR